MAKGLRCSQGLEEKTSQGQGRGQDREGTCDCEQREGQDSLPNLLIFETRKKRQQRLSQSLPTSQSSDF